MLAATSTGTGADFFTLSTLATFSGATSATVLVASVFGFLIPGQPTVQRWVAFITALVLAYVVFLVGDAPRELSDYVLAFLNGLAIFLAAYGVNETSVATGSWNQGN